MATVKYSCNLTYLFLSKQWKIVVQVVVGSYCCAAASLVAPNVVVLNRSNVRVKLSPLSCRIIAVSGVVVLWVKCVILAISSLND